MSNPDVVHIPAGRLRAGDEIAVGGTTYRIVSITIDDGSTSPIDSRRQLVYAVEEAKPRSPAT